MRKANDIDPRFGMSHLVRRGRHCVVSMYARPSYCDRGAVEVWVEVTDVDGQDRFPRYYFDLERAKGEVEDWMLARKQRIDGEGWNVQFESAETMAAAAIIEEAARPKNKNAKTMA